MTILIHPLMLKPRHIAALERATGLRAEYRQGKAILVGDEPVLLTTAQLRRLAAHHNRQPDQPGPLVA